MPALFLAGNHEVNFEPHAALAKLSRLAPKVEAVLLPGASHDLFLVRAEEVNRRLLAFFS